MINWFWMQKRNSTCENSQISRGFDIHIDQKGPSQGHGIAVVVVVVVFVIVIVVGAVVHGIVVFVIVIVVEMSEEINLPLLP